MSTYTIKQNKHRATPLRFGLCLNKKRIAYKIMFDTSCKYFIAGEDMQDINKLFGIGYFPNHHKESARFGWRYNANLNKIELFLYCYINKVRTSELITTVAFNQWFNAELIVSEHTYTFNIIRNGFTYSSVISKNHNKKIGYRLNLFFGGNQPAPHTMKIEMKKI